MTIQEFMRLPVHVKTEIAEKAVKAEIRMRKYVYGRKVLSGEMSRDDMDFGVGIMEFVLGVVIGEADRQGAASGALLDFSGGETAAATDCNSTPVAPGEETNRRVAPVAESGTDKRAHPGTAADRFSHPGL